MKLKQIILLSFVLLLTMFVVACNKNENVDGTLEDLMTKMYEGIPEESLPMMLSNTSITKDNMANYLGTSDIEIKEGLASESMVGSVAHSVVLLRISENEDVNSVKQIIKDNINPYKWVCVGVEKVIIENKGNLIIVILNDNIGEDIRKNFDNL